MKCAWKGEKNIHFSSKISHRWRHENLFGIHHLIQNLILCQLVTKYPFQGTQVKPCFNIKLSSYNKSFKKCSVHCFWIFPFWNTPQTYHHFSYHLNHSNIETLPSEIRLLNATTAPCCNGSYQLWRLKSVFKEWPMASNSRSKF